MAKILIVDDRALNRQFLTALLGYVGYHLLEATNGAEALEKLRAERPDLVITDLLMPTMDGFQLVQQIRADPLISETRVIFYSATYRLQEAKSLADACGVSIVIPKPSEPQIILETINAALRNIKPPAMGAAAILTAEPGPEKSQIKETIGEYFQERRGVNKPMTERVEHGEELARQELQLAEVPESLRQTLANLQGVSLKLATLTELGLELASQHDPERLLTVFCHAAQDIFQAKFAVLGILEDDGQSLRYYVTHGSDLEGLQRMDRPSPQAGVLSSLITEPRPRRMRNLNGDPQCLGLPRSHPLIHNFLGVPIASSQQVYGWFYLTDKLNGDEFTEADEQVAMTLAAQLAIAYQGINLYDEIQRHAVRLELEVDRRKKAEETIQLNLERIRALHEINLAITSTLDLGTVLDVLLEKTEHLHPYIAATTVRLLNKETGELNPIACRNLPEEEWKAATTQAASQGIAWLLPNDDNSPVAILNVQTEASALAREFLRKYGLVSALRVPLMAKNEVLGIITFFTSEQHEFGPEEIVFLSTLAEQGALAIQNAQLHESTKRSLDQVRALNEINVALTSTLDLHGTLHVLLEKIDLVLPISIFEFTCSHSFLGVLCAFPLCALRFASSLFFSPSPFPLARHPPTPSQSMLE